MRSSFVISIAMAMGLMLSPESLILLGNNMGTAGVAFLAAILLAVLVQISTALSYGGLFAHFQGPGSEAELIKKALGPIPAIVFPLASRVVLTICISTGMLATTGFIFNEVFLYWFPNFTFAFLLLGFLLAINLLGQKVSERFQVFFVMVVILGLIFLSVVGLAGSGNAPSITTEVSPALNFRTVLLGLVLFIGFDLAGFRKSNDNNPTKSIITGIILVGIVFSLWGLVSIIYVPPDRLADTTIPYTVAARKILGQEGRILMGLVVIAGACSAINALFSAVSRMMVGMVHQGLLPNFLGLAEKRALFPLILLAAGTAVMLAMGMAGEPALEVYVRAGLLFYLLNYAVVHLSVLIMKRRLLDQPRSFSVHGYPLVTVIGFLAISIGFVGLLWSDSESALMLRFMLIISTITFFFSFIWINISRRKGRLIPR